MSDVKNVVLKEVVEGSMAFFREARNGAANIEQAKVGAVFAQRIVSSINLDLKERLAAPKLREIEGNAA